MNKIPVAEPLLDGNEMEYVADCVRSGWVSSIGKYVGRFEEMFAEFCEAEHGVSVFNGTVALHLALAALGIGPGDEVIVPTLTFVATANTVVYTGARPVFVDSEARTWNISPESVREAITPRTRAIVPVHVYGHPCDMDALAQVAGEHGLYLVEDAAEAHGARYRGRRVGALGDAGCFSFYGNKILTTGEGGILVTNDGKLAALARHLKDHAMSHEKRYWHDTVGFNYRMTNIQAALGVAQMERIEELIETRRRNADHYNRRLAGERGITTPPAADWAQNVYWMYSVLVEDEFGMGRDEVMDALREKGIDTRPFFYPNHVLPPYNTGQSLPVAENLGRRGINLPSGATLGPGQVDRVCDELLSLRR